MATCAAANLVSFFVRPESCFFVTACAGDAAVGADRDFAAASR
jgi:hypothetical protein